MNATTALTEPCVAVVDWQMTLHSVDVGRPNGMFRRLDAQVSDKKGKERAPNLGVYQIPHLHVL